MFTIIVMGEKGTGKTSFINSLGGYIADYEDQELPVGYRFRSDATYADNMRSQNNKRFTVENGIKWREPYFKSPYFDDIDLIEIYEKDVEKYIGMADLILHLSHEDMKLPLEQNMGHYVYYLRGNVKSDIYVVPDGFNYSNHEEILWAIYNENVCYRLGTTVIQKEFESALRNMGVSIFNRKNVYVDKVVCRKSFQYMPKGPNYLMHSIQWEAKNIEKNRELTLKNALRKILGKLLDERNAKSFLKMCDLMKMNINNPAVMECVESLISNKLYVLGLFMFMHGKCEKYADYIVYNLPNVLSIQIPIIYTYDAPYEVLKPILANPKIWTDAQNNFMYTSNKWGAVCLGELNTHGAFIKAMIKKSKSAILFKLALLPVNELLFLHLCDKIPYDELPEDYANNLRYIIAQNHPFKPHELFQDRQLPTI